MTDTITIEDTEQDEVERVIEAQPFADESLVPHLAAFIKKYVALPSDDHAIVLALWVIHTWTWEHTRTTPYLYIHSDGPQCGKTLLIEVLEMLVRNPMRATSMTQSVLFRAIDTFQPTLLWDEVDTVFSGGRNEPHRNILNAGYKRGGWVYRIFQQQPRKYDTFCPKLLAGINNGFLPATVKDRAIPMKLRRRTKEQHVERFNQGDAQASPEVMQLLDRIEVFAKTWARQLRFIRPEPMLSVKDRQWEITEPLVALGACFGQEPRVRKACEAMFKDLHDAPSPQQQLLDDLRECFDMADDNGRMFTEDICTLLGPTWNGRQLALWLEPYGIEPDLLRIGNKQQRGYERSQFETLWAAE